MGIIETLQAEIQALKERVTALEQLTKGGGTPAPRQLTRDDIIEMAKRDVAELLERAANKMDMPATSASGNLTIKFVVNKEKRTVVALAFLRYVKKHPPIYKGIAKCHPDDCFNAHIGRAIALRRALGLEVPDEYLNAPQPTEVRVGDIAVITYLGKIVKVTKVDGEKVYSEDSWCWKANHKVIDDSRE